MTLFCLQAFGFLTKLLLSWSLMEALHGRVVISAAILSVSAAITQLLQWSLR